MVELIMEASQLRRMLGGFNPSTARNPDTGNLFRDDLAANARMQALILSRNPSWFPIHPDVASIERRLSGSRYEIIISPSGAMFFRNTITGRILSPTTSADLVEIARISVRENLGITLEEIDALIANAAYLPTQFAAALNAIGLRHDPATNSWITREGTRFSLSGPLTIILDSANPRPIVITPLALPRR